MLVLMMAASCILDPDASLYKDGSRSDVPMIDARPTDAPKGDRPLSDGPLVDGPRLEATPDLPIADALATYTRKWVAATVATNPGKLWGPKLTYVPSTGGVLLYGGKDTAGAAVALSWLFDGTSWQKLCDPCPPGPRVGHGLVTDAKRGVVVLFGGKNGTASNDVWELTAGVWKQVTPQGTPPAARHSAFVAYDPIRGRTVIFGGADGAGTRLDDVYEYDGASWSGPLEPTVRPSPRLNGGSAATFVEGSAIAATARDRVVIFGGEVASKVTTDDCWAWDGASWTAVCTACTQKARTGAALGYDPATGRLVLVNGYGPGEIAGTVELGQAWTQTSLVPGNRDHSGIAFDTQRNRLVLYGGNGSSCSGNCDETLEFVAP